MIHRFVILEADILTLDTAAERREAREAIRDAGLESLPIFEGPPGEPGEETGERLTKAAGEPAPELPTERELSETLAAIINPETSSDDRDAMVESLTAYGRIQIRDFRSAGVLTNNEGFEIIISGQRFQVTVVG